MSHKILVLYGSYRSDRKGGEALKHAFPRFADELRWWTEATLAQKAVRPPPY
jgi:hypothetical protein